MTDSNNQPAPEPSGRPLRIAVLAHGLVRAGGLSVGRNMLAALGRVAPQHRYLVTAPSDRGYEAIVGAMPQAELHVFGFRRQLVKRLMAERRAIRPLVRDFAPDVLLDLNSHGTIHPPCPQAILLHRPHYCYPPHHWRADTLRNKLLFRHHIRHFARALRETDLLLCQTPVMERRARERYGYTGRTSLCPNVVSTDTMASTEVTDMPEALRRLGGRPFLFCLTSYYAHKNLDVFIPMAERHGDLLGDTAIVTTVSPSDHPRARRFLERIERLGLTDRIINVGRIEQRELAAWYRRSRGLILPTLLESFSGTYVEAMHFGAPIVTSDLDFAREVCREAALYFDPWDPESIARAIRRLLDDEGLAGRLVAAGRQRLADFPTSWDAVVREMVGRLEGVVRG
jgi:glycosyltransferase involved in cell wall biosynthesis